METLNDDCLLLILILAGGFIPINRAVCRKWREMCQHIKTFVYDGQIFPAWYRPLSVEQLVEGGYQTVIEYSKCYLGDINLPPGKALVNNVHRFDFDFVKNIDCTTFPGCSESACQGAVKNQNFKLLDWIATSQRFSSEMAYHQTRLVQIILAESLYDNHPWFVKFREDHGHILRNPDFNFGDPRLTAACRFLDVDFMEREFEMVQYLEAEDGHTCAMEDDTYIQSFNDWLLDYYVRNGWNIDIAANMLVESRRYIIDECIFALARSDGGEKMARIAKIIVENMDFCSHISLKNIGKRNKELFMILLNSEKVDVSSKDVVAIQDREFVWSWFSRRLTTSQQYHDREMYFMYGLEHDDNRYFEHLKSETFARRWFLDVGLETMSSVKFIAAVIRFNRVDILEKMKLRWADIFLLCDVAEICKKQPSVCEYFLKGMRVEQLYYIGAWHVWHLSPDVEENSTLGKRSAYFSPLIDAEIERRDCEDGGHFVFTAPVDLFGTNK